MSSCRSKDPFTSACLSSQAIASRLQPPSQPGPLTSTQVRKHTHLQLHQSHGSGPVVKVAWLAACANAQAPPSLSSLFQLSRQVKVCVLYEGSWENQGLGVVKAAGAELVWTYTGSHLGHWMAAPLPSSDSKDPPPSLTADSAVLDSSVLCL